jgi:hypothetical protein
VRKYELPEFLSKKVTYEAYVRWLRRRAQAHVKRDRGRGNKKAIGESYREAIHKAVEASSGLDAYTGEALNWRLISHFDNDEAKEHGRRYKRKFALLPTVEHVGNGKSRPDFKICGWRTNDVKNDLTVAELVSVCRAFLKHQGCSVDEGGYQAVAADGRLRRPPLNGKALYLIIRK